MTSLENQAPEGTGIVIHPEKSGLIKRNGIWKGALKFLGLKFDGAVFGSSTRKGSNLLFKQEIGKMMALEQIRIEQGLKLDSMDSVIKFIEEHEKDREDY